MHFSHVLDTQPDGDGKKARINVHVHGRVLWKTVWVREAKPHEGSNAALCLRRGDCRRGKKNAKFLRACKLAGVPPEERFRSAAGTTWRALVHLARNLSKSGQRQANPLTDQGVSDQANSSRFGYPSIVSPLTFATWAPRRHHNFSSHPLRLPLESKIRWLSPLYP